jgi:hypothetical protein
LIFLKVVSAPNYDKARADGPGEGGRGPRVVGE